MHDSGKTVQPSTQGVVFEREHLDAIVTLRTRIPEDAMTAGVLGTERSGHGTLIDRSGLILPIGYLVTEAESVWIITNHEQAVPGYVVGYDQTTGFGLIQALQPLNIPALTLGSAAALELGEAVVLAGQGGAENAVHARVIAKQEFAGYWEYLLDEAIFTAPAHSNWGGAALLGNDGTLRGVGSLMIQEANNADQGSNMIVPIDLLPPVLDDLLKFGRPKTPPRPWLGMMTAEMKNTLVVVGLSETGPADQAGVRVGDLILEVAEQPIDHLAAMLRRIWQLGAAGVLVPLKLLRNGATLQLQIRSVDRHSCLKQPGLH